MNVVIGGGSGIGLAVAAQLPGETLAVDRKGTEVVCDVASVIAFLCSEKASFVTGCDWLADGGACAAFGVD